MDTDRWARAAVPLRARLVRRVTDAGCLTGPGWRTAFAQVPRHLFVPRFFRPVPADGYDLLSGADADPRRRARWLSGVYEDVPLVTLVRDGRPVSSSSQPSLMAAMLEALEAREGHTVLEIGTGTGYHAALLAHRLGPSAVTTVDLDTGITDAARGHLAAAGVASRTGDAADGDGAEAVTVLTGDGALGSAARAPYDRIVATCELPSVPPAWLRQCAPGGLVLAPMAGGLIALRVEAADRAEGHFLHTPAYFVGLRGPGTPLHPPPRAVADNAWVRHSGTPPQVLDDDVFRFVLTLAAGELAVSWAYGGRGVVLTAPDGCTARADRDGLVELTGERDLWALVEETHALWRREECPDRERFGVSTEGRRQWAWLDAPDGRYAWELAGRG